MDRHLKERLVGAAVLVAAAIILIPEMLSGPHEGSATQPSPAADVSDNGGVKTYTIDLNAPKATNAKESSKTAATVAPPAPAPEMKAQTPAAQNAAVETHKEPVNEAAIAPAARDATREKDKQTSSKPASVSSASEKNVAENSHSAVPVAAAPTQTTSGRGGWAVQVASFSARATSERIANELKAKNFPAFVTAFDSKGQAMYRVRVGPVEDRAAAEELLAKIKPLHPGAAVVAQ